ncbi:MAG: LPS export ABC transporter periplasmic protein LptC [Cytophagales bacterium]|nr:LPS export ABC transporter periplasmic protein LptC [Cytophaga sp.]
MIRLVFFVAVVCCSCMNKEELVEKIIPYGGPSMTAENIETIYSDSAHTKLILKAPVQLLLQSNDREFPKGIFVEFFDEGKEPKAILTADYAIFYKENNLYKVLGNVVVNNQRDGKKLSTPELFWSPVTQKIYTDKHVIIQTKTETIEGDGLDAKQDFSNYSIHNPIGKMLVK